jgi:hypothetical protein
MPDKYTCFDCIWENADKEWNLCCYLDSPAEPLYNDTEGCEDIVPTGKVLVGWIYRILNKHYGHYLKMNQIFDAIDWDEIVDRKYILETKRGILWRYLREMRLTGAIDARRIGEDFFGNAVYEYRKTDTETRDMFEELEGNQ